MKKSILIRPLQSVLILLFVLSLSSSLSGQIGGLTEKAIQEWLTENNVPAVGIGIIEDKELQYVKVFGEIKKGVPAPDDAIFGVASMTKPVVGMLTLKLVEAGQWDLDEPLFHYWIDPDVADDPLHRKLTTRHVLSHQTGFGNWRSGHPTKKLTFDSEPGTEYQYSGEGFEYLGHALENKFRQSLEELSDSVLFKPLGMRDTRYYWDKNMDESRFAFWHDSDGNLHEPATPKERGTIGVSAAGSLLTTVEDYCKFGIDVMSGGGLSTDLFNDMTSTQVKRKEHLAQGLGWGVVRDLPKGEYALEHGGSSRGIKTQAVFLPKSKRGIVVLTNGDNGLFVYMNVIKASLDIGETLLGYLFKGSDNPEIITLSDEILESYVGTYESTSGFLIKFTREPGALRVAATGTPTTVIYPEAEDEFFIKDIDVKFRFFRNGNGTVVRMVIYEEGRISEDTRRTK